MNVTRDEDFAINGTHIQPCCAGMKEMVDKNIVIFDVFYQAPVYEYDTVRRAIRFCPFCGKEVHNKKRYDD